MTEGGVSIRVRCLRLHPLCPVGHLPRKGGDWAPRKQPDSWMTSGPASWQFHPFRAISPPFHPHPQPPCHTCRTPAAGWTGNVPVRAGGRPLWPCRNVRQGERGGDCQRGSVGGPAHLHGRAGQAGHRDDLGPYVCILRAAAGQRTGPVAELAPSRMAREVLHPRRRAHATREGARLRAGNRAKPFRRRPLSGADGPGSPRMPSASGAGFQARRPQAGKAKQRLPVGCGHHPAIIGPRTGCATPCLPL